MLVHLANGPFPCSIFTLNINYILSVFGLDIKLYLVPGLYQIHPVVRPNSLPVLTIIQLHPVSELGQVSSCIGHNEKET
jgi:hypothetical protein